jgi:hypothetical protein
MCLGKEETNREWNLMFRHICHLDTNKALVSDIAERSNLLTIFTKSSGLFGSMTTLATSELLPK